MFKSLFKSAVAAVQKQTITILHANDHSIFRDGIKTLLKIHAPHIKLKGEAADFEEVLNILIHIPADVLLIDDRMPSGDILTALPLIKEQYPKLKIILFTMFTAPSAYLKQIILLTEGAINFTMGEEEIIRAIETVYCGGYYFHLYGDRISL